MKKQNLICCVTAVSLASVGSLIVAAHGQGTGPAPSVKAATPQSTAEQQFRVGRYTLIAQDAKDGVLRNVVVYARTENTKHFVPRLVGFSESAHMLSKARNQWVLKNVIIHSYDVTNGVKKSEVRAGQFILKPD